MRYSGARGEAVIGFCDARERGFAGWLLRPGFRHAWIATRVSNEFWLFFEWHAWGAWAELLEPGEGLARLVRFTCSGGGVVVTMPIRRLRPGVRLSWSPLTCVGAIKHMIGFKCWWAWTPWLLFCALRRAGAQVLMDGRTGRR